MKRRNAEIGKLRRPLKRTKITEGMYGNSLLYLKFMVLWVAVLMVDYMLEFRFEFLWPFWMMLRSVYDSFKYQGLAFSMFFICIALTSDMICFFFIPLQYIFFAASTYVWVQYLWYTLADKGVCLPTVAICCAVVYVEGALRGERGSSELCRPLAAHCVGYPAVTLGFGVKSYVGHRLRLRQQRLVREQNEFYFQLLRDALPESALEEQQQTSKEPERSTESLGSNSTSELKHANGSVRRKCARPEPNGHCNHENTQLPSKLDKLEKHIAQQTTARERDKSTHNHTQASTHTQGSAHTQASTHSNAQASTHAQVSTHSHAHTNGTPAGALSHEDDEHKHDHSKGSAKSSKCEKKESSSLKEEKRKNRNKDKDSADSHKSIEHVKEQIVKDKEIESLRESVKSKDCYKEKEKEKEKEKDRERETKEREKDKERERERERELRSARECAEELRKARLELAAARTSEAEARRALAAAAAADRQRRNDHNQLKQAHATLQHKVSAWRTGERASLERRLGEERRARTAAENQLLRARHPTRSTSECENEWCGARRGALEAECAALRRDLQRATDSAAQLQCDLLQRTEQVRALEARREESSSPGARLAGSWQALQERAAHLERSLSAETRVKLDLLSALGDAKRKMHIQECIILRQDKEMEELKAQMLAVMPAEFVTPVSVSAVSKLRLADGSPLDPNASVYTPKQLCSDA